MLRQFVLVAFLLSSGVVATPSPEDIHNEKQSLIQNRANECLEKVETVCNGKVSKLVMKDCIKTGVLVCPDGERVELSSSSTSTPNTNKFGASPELGQPVPPHCSLPSVTGHCRAAFKRFFFNVESGNCEQFIYGGCGGNDNNFESITACETTCKSGLTTKEATMAKKMGGGNAEASPEP